MLYKLKKYWSLGILAFLLTCASFGIGNIFLERVVVVVPRQDNFFRINGSIEQTVHVIRNFTIHNHTTGTSPQEKQFFHTDYINYKGVDLLALNASITHGSHDTRHYPLWMQDLVSQLSEKKKSIPKDKLDMYYKKILQAKPLGSWPAYNYEPLKQMLSPAYEETTEENLKVPNIVHFTWFYKNNKTLQPQEMKFFHMICILAAYKKIKPYKILLWYDIMPTGKWWDYAVRHIPNLLMVYRETPLKIFNTTIHIPEHKSDITRLEAVLTLGGVYFDLDSLALNSIDPLRNYSAVQGAPYTYSLANGVIIGAPDNLFHWLLYLSYYKYNPKMFGANSVLKGMELARKYPEYIHVEYGYILRPNIAERFYFFRDGWLWNWSLHYCFHIYARFNGKEYDYKSVQRPKNVIGEIYRHILYDEVVPNVNKRPSLFEMSWWHFERCKDKGYPTGTWDCTKHAKRFLELNQSYHFHPG